MAEQQFESVITDEMRDLIGKKGPETISELTTTSVRMFARSVGYVDPAFYDEAVAPRARIPQPAGASGLPGHADLQPGGIRSHLRRSSRRRRFPLAVPTGAQRRHRHRIHRRADLRRRHAHTRLLPWPRSTSAGAAHWACPC